MATVTSEQQKKLNLIVTVISIALPLVVAILFGVRLDINLPFNPHLLPMINAVLNGSSALMLIAALIAVKQKNIKMHSRLIYVAMGLSLVFLLLYVFYHIVTDSTKYEGDMGYVYYPILITHIILAAIQAPFVLFAFLYGFTGQIEKHKKLVKFSYPIWLYVCISGVICYLMISPYYTT